MSLVSTRLFIMLPYLNDERLASEAGLDAGQSSDLLVFEEQVEPLKHTL